MSFLSWLTNKQQTKDSAILNSGGNFRDVESMQSEVIDVALHQLKTPIVALKWSIKMLLDKTLGPLTLEQESILTQDYTSCEQAITTIESILKADRIEKQNLILHVLNNDLNGIIQNQLDELHTIADVKKINLTFQGDTNPIMSSIPFDADRIADVLKNLILNAIKYTSEGGNISIATQIVGREARVSISDTGIGIQKDHQKNIFEKFYRTPSAAKVDPNGAGLGLFIAKSIIDRHGGRIWFDSTEGRGTTFYFTLKI